MLLFSGKIKENKLCCLSTLFDNVYSDNACLRCDLPIVSDRNFLMVLILVKFILSRNILLMPHYKFKCAFSVWTCPGSDTNVNIFNIISSIDKGRKSQRLSA